LKERPVIFVYRREPVFAGRRVDKGNVMKAKIVGLFWVMVFSGAAQASSWIPLWQNEYSLLGARESGFSFTALDQAGNSYFAGYTVVKVNSDGRLAWASPLPSRGLVTLDANGNVYVVGTVATSSVDVDVAVLKYDSNGVLVWQRRYDSPEHMTDWVNGAECDRAGNLYVGGGSFTSGLGGYLTALKYDANGNLLWASRSEGSPDSVDRNTMALNPLGGVAVAGRRRIVSFSAEGELLWSWLGEIEHIEQEARLIAFDPAGNLFTEHRNLRVTKFSPAGQVLWRAGYDGPISADVLALGYEKARDLKVDALGNAFLGTDGPIRCVIVREDGEDQPRCVAFPLVVKFSPEGKLAWASRFSMPTNQGAEVKSLAVDNQGGVHLVAKVDFADADENLLKPLALLATCDPDGNQVSRTIYRPESPRTVFPFQVQLDVRQDIVMSGQLHDYEVPRLEHLLVKFRVVTEERLRIVSGPKSQTVATDATVIFRVVAKRRGPTQYQWRFNGEPIARATGPTLTLEELDPEDTGDYSVEVTEGARQIVTPEARLEVTP
jgi:hypothetical protein